MLINGAQYRESLKKLRPNIYKYGKLIEDVTTDPNTRLHVDSVAHSYDMAFDEEKKPIFTNKSVLTGEIAHRWNTLNTTMEDQIGNADMKREQFRYSGTCQGATCAGWTAMNALWAVTYDMDKELGTNYHELLKNYMLYVENHALSVAGALTDAKGNRSLKPSQQENPDSVVHIVEEREDGIVISGYKVQICGIAACHEIMVVPGSGYKDTDKDFAVACAVPRDAEGLTIVETRRPSDERDLHEGWDSPKVGNITQAFLLFDHVFVPKERVFINKEAKYCGQFIGIFAAIYRSAIGACVAGQGDVMCGAAINMARANGLTRKTFQDKLTQMAINNELTYGLGIGAIAKGKQHPSGLFIPDALLAHVNKTQVGSIPYTTKVMATDISGGIAETGCMPPYEDFMNEKYGGTLIKALTAGCDGESRARAARLVEWLTVGGGIPGCMHGGGSPDGARMVVKAMEPWEEFAQTAKHIAGITADLSEEKK